MVAKILVDRDIEAGKRLVLELDRIGFPLSAAMWLCAAEEDRYQLVLATSNYDGSPLDAFRMVHEAIDRIPDDCRPSFADVSIVSPGDRVIQAVRKLVKTHTSVGGARLFNAMINDVDIADAWIYRST
ncbi:MAG: hypothetical protein HOP29_05625 [Phycisphaerales bacterium]|nr:hypothetical protein [Phycisphaerales bacterium]